MGNAGPAVALEVRQNTPAWVDARRDYIGSSDLPILTGNSPYGTSVFSLWAIKTRLAEPDPVDPETQELWDLGHLLEDDIAERYTLLTGRPLRRVNRMLVHREISWASANLDRVSARRGERRIVELKWVPHRHWLTDGPEPIPPYVQDQVQWQLMVTGWPAADVAVLNGSRVEHYELEPDAEYQDNLLYLARWFRGLVDRGERPPVDGSEATRKTLTRLHPRPVLDLMPATAETDALAHELHEARVRAKTASAEADRLANVMRSVLGDHAGVEGDGYRISWLKNADSQRVDWRAVVDAYHRLLLDRGAPAETLQRVLEEHTEPIEGARVLRVKYRDEETGRWT
jgi:putative phage-type endonuclease